jgi:maltose alpha-D-glucosyltransferase/alpha-amylase
MRRPSRLHGRGSSVGELPYLLTLPPYGFYWFELDADAAPPDWHVEQPERVRELATLVLRSKHPRTFGEAPRKLFEREALPAYLARQRWSAAGLSGLCIDEMVPLQATGAPAAQAASWHCWVLLGFEGSGARRLSVPVTLCWNEDARPAYPIARVRCGADTGILVDAVQEAGFLRALVDGLSRAPAGGEPEPRAGPSSSGQPVLHYRRVADALEPLPPDADVRWVGGEQSNSSAIVDEQIVIKVLRQVGPEPDPAIEMSRWLTQAGYANAPALLGTVECHAADGSCRTLAVLHRYVPNEGNAWQWTLEFLHRNLEATLLTGNDATAFEESLSGYLALARRMGRRVAELHAVFARPVDAEDGGPPPATAGTLADIAADGRRALHALSLALEALARQPADILAPLRDAVAFLRTHRVALASRVDEVARLAGSVMRLRGHGDLHLGQILVSHADAYLIDFEGEPLSDPERRREASTIYKDLAGMLRSFDYAAALARREEDRTPGMPETPSDAAAWAGLPQAPGAAAAAPPAELLSIFRARAGAAFLDGYRDARAPALALSDETESALLTIFQLEKAAYEVRYEAAHRPEWLPIPVHALVRLAGALLGLQAAPAAGGSP